MKNQCPKCNSLHISKPSENYTLTLNDEEDNVGAKQATLNFWGPPHPSQQKMPIYYKFGLQIATPAGLIVWLATKNIWIA